mmetsp:Transcript_16233/g.32397  ORF Transcript_16233/g.32397 Transcript_16233/m.32397 type:complete len:361 (+) Transcript_16233:178-1260(+)
MYRLPLHLQQTTIKTSLIKSTTLSTTQRRLVSSWKLRASPRPKRAPHSGEPLPWQPPSHSRGPSSSRPGVLALKAGMTHLWDQWGQLVPVTVLHVDRNRVLQTKTLERDGYDAVQVGAGGKKRKNEKKPEVGHVDSLLGRPEWSKKALSTLSEYSVTQTEDGYVPEIIREFRMHHHSPLPPGSRLSALQFVPGQKVDVSGTTKGKGFQGGMKRHGFGGMPATHGVSKVHRAIGSSGQCQTPGKVWKGKKMAGRMGGDRQTTQMLQVVKVDRGLDLLYVKGAVPGSKGNWVLVSDAKKGSGLSPDLCRMVNEEAGEEVYPGGAVPYPLYEREEGVDGSGRVGNEVWRPKTGEDPFAMPEEE